MPLPSYITDHPLIPLVKASDGNYPFPRMRYGILPYYLDDKDKIFWGCVETNRVEPITFDPAAGTQDVIAIKENQYLVLELSKPISKFNDDFCFLHEFQGQLFRDEVYQRTLSCLIRNGFSIYLENPLSTAIHEAYEEHGIDLQGRDKHLLALPLALAQCETLPPQIGIASPLTLWLPQVINPENIELRYVNKIDTKMRRNFGRAFYERGVWNTLEFFRQQLSDETTKFSSLDTSIPVKVELITEALQAFTRNVQFIEKIESFLQKRLQQETEITFSFPSKPTYSTSQSVFKQRFGFFNTESSPQAPSLAPAYPFL